MIVEFSNEYIRERIQRHIKFCADRIKEKGSLKHINTHYGFPVMTAQEKDLLLNTLVTVEKTENDDFVATYANVPQTEFYKDLDHSA